MSARPFVPRLSDEDLDLLLSRSLDGDLSPEEEHDLETLLAHDPAAARRKEELQRLVAEARALPAPAPPFALATRVNSNVSEKGGRGGSVFHRFGFYPPPGMAVGAMALLGIVAVAIAVLRPAPLRVAQRVEGPVDVFLTEGGEEQRAAKRLQPEPPKVASKEATRSRSEAAPAAPAPAERAPAAVVASAPEKKNKLEGKLDDKPVDAEKARLAEEAGRAGACLRHRLERGRALRRGDTGRTSRRGRGRSSRRPKRMPGWLSAVGRRAAPPAPALDAAAGQAARVSRPLPRKPRERLRMPRPPAPGPSPCAAKARGGGCCAAPPRAGLRSPPLRRPRSGSRSMWRDA